MIKREFGQSEIKVLTSRVQMAEKTVKDGEQLDTDLQRNVINAEDIAVDLTEENLDLNAGDFVYIKLPDSLVFKAQITEKKYDPKIKSDSKNF